MGILLPLISDEFNDGVLLLVAIAVPIVDAMVFELSVLGSSGRMGNAVVLDDFQITIMMLLMKQLSS